MSRVTAVPPIHKKRTPRDLANAVTLRPRDVFELYGIPPSTFHEYCTVGRDGHVLASMLIPGRGGKFGLRIAKRTDIDTWLEHFRVAQPPASQAAA